MAYRMLLLMLTAAMTMNELHAQQKRSTSFIWGAHVTNPQKVSATLGLIHGSVHSDGNLKAIDGPMVEVETGLGGIRGYVGFGTYFRPAWLGYSFGVAVLRTWRDPWTVAPGRTYVGANSDFSYFLPNLKLGLYYCIDGNIRRRFLISVGAGFKW
jgi:hypothetical protein